MRKLAMGNSATSLDQITSTLMTDQQITESELFSRTPDLETDHTVSSSK
jgi:hypothetical protein